jgi:hypothetical protein
MQDPDLIISKTIAESFVKETGCKVTRRMQGFDESARGNGHWIQPKKIIFRLTGKTDRERKSKSNESADMKGQTNIKTDRDQTQDDIISIKKI